MKIVAYGILLVALACGCAAGGETRYSWRSSYFDGREFRHGSSPQSVIVYHRQGFMPVLGTAGDRPPEVPLPEGTGSVVIHCYVESSGGKLRSQRDSRPAAGKVIELDGDDGKRMLTSDATGYAVASLQIGNYTASVDLLSTPFTISRGTTTLLSIRTGKRMVD